MHRKLALVPPQANLGSHMLLPSVESWLPRTEKLDKLHILGEMSVVAAEKESGCASNSTSTAGACKNKAALTNLLTS